MESRSTQQAQHAAPKLSPTNLEVSSSTLGKTIVGTVVDDTLVAIDSNDNLQIATVESMREGVDVRC